jgi:hypothetical protein
VVLVEQLPELLALLLSLVAQLQVTALVVP